MSPAVRAVLAFGGAALVAVVLVYWWFGRSPGGADANDHRLVAQGQAVYAAQCAVCHGADLRGQPNWRQRKADGRLPAPPHDETGHTWHHPDQVLFDITRIGLKPPIAPAGYESDMPAFGGVLTDQEIWAALAFIKSTWPPRQRDQQDRINQQYKK